MEELDLVGVVVDHRVREDDVMADPVAVVVAGRLQLFAPIRAWQEHHRIRTRQMKGCIAGRFGEGRRHMVQRRDVVHLVESVDDGLVVDGHVVHELVQ